MQSCGCTAARSEAAKNQRNKGARFLHDFRTNAARFVLFCRKCRFVHKRRKRAEKVRVSCGFKVLVQCEIERRERTTARPHDFFTLFRAVGVK